jgi:hypothetical protein
MKQQIPATRARIRGVKHWKVNEGGDNGSQTVT